MEEKSGLEVKQALAHRFSLPFHWTFKEII